MEAEVVAHLLEGCEIEPVTADMTLMLEILGRLLLDGGGCPDRPRAPRWPRQPGS